MTPSDLGAALRPVLAALDGLGVRHFVTGSIASSAHGVPRASIDADVVAELQPGHAPVLLEALASDYYVPVHLVMDAIRQGASFNVIHLDTMVKIDVFVAHGDADLASLGRVARVRLDDGTAVPICSAEDSLLSKLTWYHRGGETSERQWTDVLGLLQVATLDMPYLRARAAERGVAHLLERAIADLN